MEIGKYEIVEELGRGSMGIVYRARDPLLDRHVAIKLVSTENVDELTLPLFEREAKVIARMSHPNIVVVHEYDYFKEEPFIVMELLKGRDLETRAAEGNFSVTDSLNIIHQTLSGLHHAHGHGVIHRDIKPTNIFVTDSNVVKILDFGIARLAVSSTVTEGFVLGTPEYMSPEQIKSEELDGRTDLFSVGSVLYWLFTGETPFSADTAEATMVRIVSEDPRPMQITGASPMTQSGLIAILNRALAKDPKDRFRDAAEMAKEIENLTHIVEQEAELEGQHPDLEYMETLQVAKPKFSTTAKAANARSSDRSESSDVSATPPTVPPPTAEEPVTPSTGESGVIDKTVEFRTVHPRPIAVPRPVSVSDDNAPAAPPETPESIREIQPNKLSLKTIFIVIILVLALAAFVALSQCS